MNQSMRSEAYAGYLESWLEYSLSSLRKVSGSSSKASRTALSYPSIMTLGVGL